jgi:hypothetical protein
LRRNHLQDLARTSGYSRERFGYVQVLVPGSSQERLATSLVYSVERLSGLPIAAALAPKSVIKIESSANVAVIKTRRFA